MSRAAKTPSKKQKKGDETLSKTKEEPEEEGGYSDNDLAELSTGSTNSPSTGREHSPSKRPRLFVSPYPKCQLIDSLISQPLSPCLRIALEKAKFVVCSSCIANEQSHRASQCQLCGVPPDAVLDAILEQAELHLEPENQEQTVISDVKRQQTIRNHVLLVCLLQLAAVGYSTCPLY